jgi:hypothetical protein
MTIGLVSVVGGDTALLGYSIAHYRALGVESFHITRHVEDEADPRLAESVALLHDQGLEFSRICVGPWHEDLNARLIRETMARAPHDWWIIADLDEFQVYDRPLPEIVRYCDDEGYDYVSGAMLDRVATGGALVDPEPYGRRPIWEQYPLAGLVTFRVVRGIPTKVTLARGTVELDLGQHRAWGGIPVPRDVCYPQVHHFKWTATVQSRLHQRAAAYFSGHWKTADRAVIAESVQILHHIRANGGRIDVARPDCAFLPCGSRYEDYGSWSSARLLWNDLFEDFDRCRAATRPLLRMTA